MIIDPVYVHIMFLLAANNLGTTGENLFGGEWGGPDEQTLVLDGVGVPSELKDTFENPGFQIICRGSKPSDTGYRDIDVYQKAKAISNFLLAQTDHVEIQGVCYTGFEPSTNIAPLGKDENERFMYSMNFTTFRNAF